MDILKEKLEYKKRKHKELIKILDNLKKNWFLWEVAESKWISRAMLSHIRNKNIRLSTIENYLTILSNK